MGNYFSTGNTFHSDPSTFATQVNPEVAASTSKAQAQVDYEAYDYVIIGAGAAGAVIASRLSEDPNVTVLLIEAGGNNADSPFSKIPLAFAKHFKTSWDWAFYTCPQPNLNNRELFWPRGKMLGGSTSINAMMYTHGAPSDFDEWETLGAKGWSYKDLAPYFRKSENFTPNVLYPNVKPAERGDSGLWQTSYSYCTDVCAKFLDACEEVGIPKNPDINTPRGTLGATKIVTFIDNKGSRSSSATAYLSKDVVARKNLTIAIYTHATRILFDAGEVPTAIGVEVATSDNSPSYRVAARKEIILSAGALNTPKILNLSGIGAKAELEKFNIPLIKDLPAVGKHLSDHLVSGITYRAKSEYSLDYMASDIKSLPAIIYWLFTGKGPASSNLGESAAFVRSLDSTLPYHSNAVTTFPEVTDTTSGSDAPDLEILAAPVSFINHGFTRPPQGMSGFSIVPVLLRPLSTGSVHLQSADPFEKVVVDANYLSHPNDMKVLNLGVRLSLRISRSKALQPCLDLPVHSEEKDSIWWPGDASPDHIKDEELEDWIRSHAETLYHPVGTARIGYDEKDSVIDTHLKVHGVNGLRVVDASTFPRQISGHPTATIIAMGEKASDMITHGV